MRYQHLLASTLTLSFPANAATSFDGVLNSKGVFDYAFHFDGGPLSIAVDKGGSNPIFDPFLYLFADNGSPVNAKTGSLIAYDDDGGGYPNSLLNFDSLSAGNYIISVGEYYLFEANARADNANGFFAGHTFTVTFNADVKSLNSAVPEPATWALLIAGFFGCGSVLRSKRYRPSLILTRT